MTQSQPTSPDRAVAGEIFARAEPCFAQEPSGLGDYWVARAPGRLEIMGGIAEYSGGEVIAAPLADGFSATVRLRDDGKYLFHGIGKLADSSPDPCVIDAALLAQRVPSRLADSLPDALWLRAAVGAVHALLAADKCDSASSGATIVVDGTMRPHIDAGTGAAVAVTVIMALLHAWGMKLDPIECAVLAADAENGVGRHPCGRGAALAALHARAGHLVVIDCLQNTLRDAITIPGNVQLLGIDCGYKAPDAGDKYLRARTTAMMGRQIIQHRAASTDGFPFTWTGSLAQIAPEDFVKHLKTRVPTKMRGRDFIDRFGALDDPHSCVDLSALYRIRSRTEHHIYEPMRAREFLKWLSTASTTGNRDDLVAAGEEIYSSNWSYGQRCGLGSVQTERLVTELRSRGAKQGIFGAKASGQGSGGIVVVFLENTPAARDALNHAIHAYEKTTGHNTEILEGTSPGALSFGVHQFDAP